MITNTKRSFVDKRAENVHHYNLYRSIILVLYLQVHCAKRRFTRHKQLHYIMLSSKIQRYMLSDRHGNNRPQKQPGIKNILAFLDIQNDEHDNKLITLLRHTDTFIMCMRSDDSINRNS